MSYKRTVAFALTPSAKGLCAVRCRLSMPRQGRREFALTERLRSEEWDTTAQRPKPRKAKAVATEIAAVIAAIDQTFARWELVEKRPPSIDEVVSEVLITIGRAVDAPLPSMQIAAAYEEWLPTTSGTTVCRAVGVLLRRVCPCATVGDLDGRLIERIRNALASEGRANTTANAYLTVLRSFAAWCARKGYRPNAPLDVKPLPTLKGVEPIYLTPSEIAAVKCAELPAALEAVRDEFLLDCFCGLRHSDSNALTPANVRGGALHVVTQKTRAPLIVELNAESERVVNRRLALGGATLFPRMSATLAARKVREVCHASGVTDLVSVTKMSGEERTTVSVPKWMAVGTHTARRTFVVNALTLGISAEVIMRWTGHSSWSSMKPYVAIADRLRKESMARFDALLPSPNSTQDGGT